MTTLHGSRWFWSVCVTQGSVSCNEGGGSACACSISAQYFAQRDHNLQHTQQATMWFGNWYEILALLLQKLRLSKQYTPTRANFRCADLTIAWKCSLHRCVVNNAPLTAVTPIAPYVAEYILVANADFLPFLYFGGQPRINIFADNFRWLCASPCRCCNSVRHTSVACAVCCVPCAVCRVRCVATEITSIGLACCMKFILAAQIACPPTTTNIANGKRAVCTSALKAYRWHLVEGVKWFSSQNA